MLIYHTISKELTFAMIMLKFSVHLEMEKNQCIAVMIISKLHPVCDCTDEVFGHFNL